MSQPPRMPLSAVGMMAAHLLLERVRMSGMDDRQLSYTIPGRQTSYRRSMMIDAVLDAWNLTTEIEQAAETFRPKD